MKRILLFALAGALFSSCMKDTGYETNYTLVDSYDYDYRDENNKEIFPNEENYFVFPEGGFSTGDVAYFANSHETFFGNGFLLSQAAWKKAEKDESEEGGSEQSGSEQSAENSEPGLYSVYGGENRRGGYNNSSTFLYYKNYSSAGDLTKPKFAFQFLYSADGTCAPKSIMVNNTAATVRAIKGETLEEGVFDFDGTLKLTAKGYLNDAETGSASFILAGKSVPVEGKEQPVKDSIVTKWTAFDLSKLGNIDYIDFKVTGGEALGITEVCFDNFTAAVHIKISGE